MSRPEADIAALSAANTGFYQAIEHGDLDLMGALWCDAPLDDVRCVHPGTSLLRGRGEVMRGWAMVMASTSYIQFFITDVVIDVLGDTAVVTCTENILTGVSAPDGSPSAFSGGRAVATNVFRRTGAGWRLWVHHSSPVLDSSAEEDDAG